jgi:predicted phosphatase
MRWTRKTTEQLFNEFHAQCKSLRDWHVVFAWKWVEVEPGKFVWLERVLRRANYSGRSIKIYRKRFIFFKDKRINPYTLDWEYKADIFDILKEK